MPKTTEQLTNRTTGNSAGAALRDGVVLSVRDVSKKFCKTLRRSMAYGIVDMSKNLLGIPPDSSHLRKGEFWAVDGINLELRRGDSLGLIGPNGSGKTTLLRLIAGIFPPDRGEIAVRGRVGTLISLGAGFHPHMTGRENIYLNGSILGMSRREIGEHFDEIVEFSELEDFMDTPVSAYSSGMKVRLGFSIAVHIDPDLLLVDEVLAVGDVGFRAKCYNLLGSLLERCAVIFVSHQTTAVARMCGRCIVLSRGRAAFDGATEQAIERYLDLFKPEGATLASHDVELQSLTIREPSAQQHHRLTSGGPMVVTGEVHCRRRIADPIVMLHFFTRSGQPVAEWNSRVNGYRLAIGPGRWGFCVQIPSLRLRAGSYEMSLLVTGPDRLEHLLWVHRQWSFTVEETPTGVGAYQVEGRMEVLSEGTDGES